MLIGILSDSHGRVRATRDAVSLLASCGAEKLIHLGDIGSEDVLDELVGRDAHIVLGNCDYELEKLSRYAELLDIRVDHPLGELVIDSKKIAFTHGHLEDHMERALKARPDYLLHGHTHKTRDQRIGTTRVINPGALFRAVKHTAALLDVAEDTLEFVEVK